MQGYGKRQGSESELVSTSEIAAFVYCPEGVAPGVWAGAGGGEPGGDGGG
jgi:hypothetical protein